jgi:hypothetical protein
LNIISPICIWSWIIAWYVISPGYSVSKINPVISLTSPFVSTGFVMWLVSLTDGGYSPDVCTLRGPVTSQCKCTVVFKYVHPVFSRLLFRT